LLPVLSHLRGRRALSPRSQVGLEAGKGSRGGAARSRDTPRHGNPLRSTRTSDLYTLDCVTDAPARLRAIDLFCGAGGLSEGFRAAGFDVTFALDRDRDAVATYRANHRDTVVHQGSITDLSPARLAELAGGRVDVIVGGPSCQGFSTANKARSGADDERNELWTHMMAVVQELEPRAFVLENVPGMVQFRDGGLGAEIVAGFESLGYVVQHRILLAADYGVPQRRRRLFIVGVREGLRFEFPQPTHHGAWRRDRIDAAEQVRSENGLLPHVSCWEAIADLPALCDNATVRYRRVAPSPFAAHLRGDNRQVSGHDAPPLAEAHAALISQVPQGGTWRDVPAHLLPARFHNMRRTDSTNLLGRLEPTLPSYTMTTQFINVTTGCNTHPFEDRSLSIREGARLQSFPDAYEFHGTMTSRARQIGNAVPPLLAHAIGWKLAEALLDGRAPHRSYEPPVIEPAASVPSAPIDPATGRPRRAPMSADTATRTLVARALAARGIAVEPEVLVTAEDDATSNDGASTPRGADLLLPESRIAVLVNGCFLHGCDEHASTTRSSTFWWAARIRAYRATYDQAVERLTVAGWTVVTVWDHEDPTTAAERIAAETIGQAARSRVKLDALTG
jgi:DNA (cytosine-5)-methyltransferase 1